jgi:hypothetical protein
MRQLLAADLPAIRLEDLDAALTQAGVQREALVDRGLMFVRRGGDNGAVYFVANRGDRRVEGWIPFRLGDGGATIFDAMRNRRGLARTRFAARYVTEVYLELAPGESLIVAGGAPSDGQTFDFFAPAAAPIPIEGPWAVRFVSGGPSLPAARSIAALRSWTSFGGDDVVTFAGTASYAVTFGRPAATPPAWRIDLGAVHETARVRLNGRDVATLIGPPYQVVVRAGELNPVNQLEVSVTNLSANRIADLDRRGVPWKKFYNVNMPSKLPENRGPDGLFTAAKWDPLPSGLLGPVTLTPVSVR